MERFRHQQTPGSDRFLGLFAPPMASSKPNQYPMKPFSPKPRPPPSFRACYTSPKTPDHLSSLLRHADVALTVPAGLLLTHFCHPGITAASNSSQATQIVRSALYHASNFHGA